jgi:rubrerythrin
LVATSKETLVSTLDGFTDIGEPPPISPGNPMPMEWGDSIPRHRGLWERAEEQHYDPNVDINWSALDPNDFTPEQRVALAYWFATNAVFENSAAPTFAVGMIKAYEEHMGLSTGKLLLTIARDEANHDEMQKRIVERLLPGFPNHFEPTTPDEAAACRNLQWIQYMNSRYWGGFRRAAEQRRLLALMSYFAAGEAATSLIFQKTGANTEHPVLRDVLRHISVDESRHFACFNFMSQQCWGDLTDEEKQIIGKNLKAGYLYISIVFGDPKPPFWDVPDGFRTPHVRFHAIARDAGVGILSAEERDDVWRKSMLRMKAVGDRFGVPWPRIEDLDIDGEDTPIGEEDLVVVSF